MGIDRRVLEYMNRVGYPVTAKEINEQCGTSEARKVISNLRRAGHDVRYNWVTVENRFGEKCRIKEYWING